MDLYAMLNILIVDLVTFFNVGKTMNQAQINLTIPLIIEEFNFFKIDDFKLCFKNAMKGLYGNGKLYDRIDGQVLFEWLNEHKNQRMDAFEAKSIKEHNDLKKTEKHELTEIQAKNIQMLKDNYTNFLKQNEQVKTSTPAPIVNLPAPNVFKERFMRNRQIYSKQDLEKMRDIDFKDRPEIQKIINQEIKNL